MDNFPGGDAPSENGNGAYTETDLIETTDEEGTVHVFEKISELDVDDQEYALLIYRGKPGEDAAAASDGEDEEVVVMRVMYEDGAAVFEAIDDEDEFNRVVSRIETMNADDEDIEIDLSDFMAPKDKDDDEPAR